MGTESRFRRVSYELRAGRVAGLAWGDPTRPPDILFLHATGFNARTYAGLLGPLGERFHVLAVDLRGHGKTSLPAKLFGYGSWNRHRDDVVELIEEHLRAPVTLAGHSMGATVALLVAGKRPDLARGVAMIDPVILSPGYYAMMHVPMAPLVMNLAMPIARGAARRRRVFESKDAAEQALHGRSVFASFPEQQLEDYVGDGFVETIDGVALACDPAWEARTFCAQRHDPWSALVRAPAPLICVRAERRSTTPPASAERMKQMRPEVRLAVVEGATHMLPMERPDRARAAIETAAMMANPSGYRDLV
jgi:pimeloyl-ACP methyl ester carboxylesterase